VDHQDLISVLRSQTEKRGNDTAFTFLRDGDSDEDRSSFAQLDRRARAVAARLRRHGKPGDRALILYPAGLDYLVAFFGCLYAGVIAVPAYIPRRHRSIDRLRSILADARPVLGLTPHQVSQDLEARSAEAPELSRIRWCAVEDVADDEANEWNELRPDGQRLAFLQYTSGSTGSPKGVMLSHANLLHNQEMIRTGFEHDDQTRFVGWLPLFHDMGLIGNILQPLYLGIPCVLLSPIHFVERPARWLRAISRYRGTTSGGPNFAYDLCVRKIAPAERATLDLSSWNVAFNGAEPVRAETLARFTAAFEVSGFRPECFCPVYGLAEASLIVSGGFRSRVPTVKPVDAEVLKTHRVRPPAEPGSGARLLVGCGRSLLDQRVAIVHPDTCVECGPGEVGEIWVSSGSVAQGYWEDAEETDRVFHAQLVGGDGSRFLRTGDLGFLDGDELYVTGRLHDLIIIRGRNYYPQDIERTAEDSHPMLIPAGGGAFSVDVDGEDRLVVVHEVHRHCLGDELQRAVSAIRHAVSEAHELQVYAVELVKAGSIPKTSSGKIQRRACRRRFLSGAFEAISRDVLSAHEPGVATGDQPLDRRALLSTEPADRPAALAAHLQAELARALKVDASTLDPRRPLLWFGIDSLQVIEVAHGIETQLGVTLSISELLEDATIASIASIILERVAAAQAPAATREASSPPQLQPSAGQRALWFLHQLDPASAAYNLSRAIELGAPVDVAQLKRACRALVERHSSLRTVFLGEAALRIDPPPADDPREVDATAWSDDQLDQVLCEDAHRPFDLERGPLVRFALFGRAGGACVLFMSAHHAICDLWSFAILIDELRILYTGGALPPRGDDGWAHAIAERELLSGPDGARLFAYWQRALDSCPAGLDLPSDRPRPPQRSDHGGTFSFAIGEELTRRVDALSRAQHATLYTTLFAAFSVLVHRLTGQDDIVVGSPMANRTRPGHRSAVGDFMNPVVLRADVSGNPRFIELVRQIKRTVTGAIAHQALPFAALVARLSPVRDHSRTPLFNVMFALQSTSPVAGADLSALTLGTAGAVSGFGPSSAQSRPIAGRASAFDLTLSLAKAADQLTGVIQYSTELFDEATVSRMARQYLSVLEALVRDPAQRVDYLPLGDDSAPLAAIGPAPPDACVHQLFEAQVARTPDAIAVIFKAARLSYAELDARASEIARRLQALGVGPDALVAVLAERSIEMVVALLGVWKAGGAYLPLDPAHPGERLEWILRDAGASVLLTDHAVEVGMDIPALRRVGIADVDARPDRADTDAPSLVQPRHLAYVIYTSGSTGRPKGVEVEHRAVANIVRSVQREAPISANDTLLALTTISFDIAALELFWPLSVGATIHLVDRGCAGHGVELGRAIAEAGATVMQATPSTWRMLLEAGWRGRKGLVMLCGGEALPPALADALRDRGGALFNMYGPTETTIWSAMGRVGAEVDPGLAAVPLGPPIDQTTLDVRDRYGQPLPIGVVGELCIGGVGLARGYRNRPELTAERFVADERHDSARLYRTGDRARRRSDGRFDFLGRFDHQLKIRGTRLEPGEIEVALRSHPDVRDAVVMARPGADGAPILVAYVVADARRALPDELSQLLRRTLPEQYVPASYVVLAQFPLNGSQKVDRGALPAPDRAGERRREYVAPRTPVEREIVAVWQQVLGLPKVGVEDNFFELGGHSLLLGRVHAMLQTALSREVSMRELFQHATVRALAARLEAVVDSTGPSSTAEASARIAGKDRLRQRLVRNQQLSRKIKDGRDD
jgi:amino acid adenylation domain-containing protein